MRSDFEIAAQTDSTTTDVQPRSEFPSYARAVWEVYCERRGSEFPIVSPVEFDLMRKWYEHEIPVRYVAMALRTTKGDGRTLTYYNQAVLAEAVRAHRAMNL